MNYLVTGISLHWSSSQSRIDDSCSSNVETGEIADLRYYISRYLPNVFNVYLLVVYLSISTSKQQSKISKMQVGIESYTVLM